MLLQLYLSFNGWRRNGKLAEEPFTLLFLPKLHLFPPGESHHLERVEEPGQLVEPLRAVVGHPITDDAVKLIDVGET